MNVLSEHDPRPHEELVEQQGKALILEAARQQVLEEGIDALSVRTVAKRAHYSPAGMYRHYASIADLRVDLTQQVAEEYRQMLIERFGGDENPDITNLFRYTTEWANEQGHLADLMLLHTAEDFWPEEHQLEWLTAFPSMIEASDERRRAICVLSWDILRSIWLLSLTHTELDAGKLWRDFTTFVRGQIADGTL